MKTTRRTTKPARARAKRTARSLDVTAEVARRRRGPAKDCKKYTKKRVTEEWPTIVESLVENAKKGSYNHAKLLVDMSEMTKTETGAKKRKGKSLTTILTDELKRKNAEHADREAKKSDPAKQELADA